MFINSTYTPSATIPFEKPLIQSADVNTQTTTINTYLEGIDDQRALASQTANITLVANRDIYVPVDTSAGAVTITLPATSAHNTQPIKILKISQDTNPVIIQRADADTIDNVYNPLTIPVATSINLRNPFEQVDLYPQQSTSYWRIVGSQNTFRLATSRVQAGTQSITTGSQSTGIQFGTGTTVSDKTGIHSEVTNNTRFTVWDTANYKIEGAVRFQDNTGGGTVGAWFRVNGNTIVNPQAFSAKDPAGRRYVTVNNAVSLTAGQYVELIGFHDSGSARIVTDAFIYISVI